MAAESHPNRQYSDADLLDPIREYAAEHGRPPISTEYSEIADASYMTLGNRFGSYADGVAAAGCDPADIPDHSGKPPKYGDDELLEWIKSYVAVYDVVPSSNDLDGWPGPSPDTYRYRFGSVAAAVREAGFEPRGDG